MTDRTAPPDYRPNDAWSARLDLETLQRCVAELQLESDPDIILKKLAFISGRVVSLRANMKRRKLAP